MYTSADEKNYLNHCLKNHGKTDVMGKKVDGIASLEVWLTTYNTRKWDDGVFDFKLVDVAKKNLNKLLGINLGIHSASAWSDA